MCCKITQLKVPPYASVGLFGIAHNGCGYRLINGTGGFVCIVLFFTIRCTYNAINVPIFCDICGCCDGGSCGFHFPIVSLSFSSFLSRRFILAVFFLQSCRLSHFFILPFFPSQLLVYISCNVFYIVFFHVIVNEDSYPCRAHSVVSYSFLSFDVDCLVTW